MIGLEGLIRECGAHDVNTIFRRVYLRRLDQVFELDAFPLPLLYPGCNFEYRRKTGNDTSGYRQSAVSGTKTTNVGAFLII